MRTYIWTLILLAASVSPAIADDELFVLCTWETDKREIGGKTISPASESLLFIRDGVIHWLTTIERKRDWYPLETQDSGFGLVATHPLIFFNEVEYEFLEGLVFIDRFRPEGTVTYQSASNAWKGKCKAVEPRF